MAEFDAPALPPALAADPRFSTLCNILWEQHSKLPIEQILLYLVDTAPDVALQPLAEQFSLLDEVIWPEASTPATKRQLIKQSIDWHRRKGTPWAVKTALSVLGGHTDLVEWFAQSPPGAPYTFTVEHAPDLKHGSATFDETWFDRITAIVNVAKSARSHLDTVRLVLTAGHPAIAHIGAFTAATDTIDLFPYQPGALEYTTPVFGYLAQMSYEMIDLTPLEAP